jgi:hypothetical protein
MRKCSYAADDALSRTLHSRLRWHRRVESLAGCGTHRYLMSAVRRTLGHRRDYYSHLMEHYPQLRVRVDSGSADHLNRVNFDRVFERRRELATLYLDELDERLRFPLPDASFTGQALLAFPVRVADQMAFHRHLRRGGIEGYWLADRWWFQDRPPSELFRHHYLLPLHHGLTDGEVRRVAVRANQFAAEAALQGRPVMRAASR